jgi:predicted TIM-barrel fold metal-dependent hydrolase
VRLAFIERPMIDAHIHVVPPNLPGAGCLHPICNEPPDTIAAALRAEMRAAAVTDVFAMGEWNAGPTDPLGIHRTLRIAELVPGLRAIGVADPTRGDDPEHLRRVEAELARGRVVALKAYLGYLHFGPEHPNYRPYYELAARFKLPVIFHTGDTYSPQAKLKYAQPLGVDEVAVDHPDCRFVIAHCGNPWMIDAAQVVYKNLNVWADLSGLVVGEGAVFAAEESRDLLADLSANVRRAFRYAERPNRFVFGTDWPLVPIAPYRQFIASVIPAHFHSAVFEENARMLFRLPA